MLLSIIMSMNLQQLAAENFGKFWKRVKREAVTKGWCRKEVPSGKLTWPIKIPNFPGKYHQNGEFSMGYVSLQEGSSKNSDVL